MSIKTIEDLKDYDGAALVCLPFDNRAFHTDDSVVRSCQICEGDIFVSKSGLIASGGDPLLVCITCFKKTDVDDSKMMKPTQGQLDSIKRTMGKGAPDKLSDLPSAKEMKRYIEGQ